MTPSPTAVIHLGVVPSSSSTQPPIGGVTTENGDHERRSWPDALSNAVWLFECAEMELAEVVADYLNGQPRSSANRIRDDLGLWDVPVVLALDYLEENDELISRVGDAQCGEDPTEMYYSMNPERDT